MAVLTGNDLFARIMIEMWDERDFMIVPQGFQGLFGRTGRTVFTDDATVIDIDIIRGNSKTAKLQLRGKIGRSLGDNSKSLNEQKFNNINREFPLSQEDSNIDGTQVRKRIAGEMVHSPLTVQQRLTILAMREIKELQKRTTRMFERLAAQAAVTGIQDAVMGTSDPNEQYNFGRNAGNTFAAANTWDNALGTVLVDMDLACDVAAQNGNLPPDILILGTDSMNAMLTNADFKVTADNRRINLMTVGRDNPVPSRLSFMVANGFDARGVIQTPAGRELWLFTYADRFYETDAGVKTPYMPPKEGLYFSSLARTDRYFGPNDSLPETPTQRRFYTERFGLDPRSMPAAPEMVNSSVIRPDMFMNRAWGAQDSSSVTVVTESAPIFAPIMVDAFVRMTALSS